MRYSALSDIGLKMDNNEDNWNIVLGSDGSPVGFIIADGMGGHLAGEEASRIAVEEMSSVILESVSSIDEEVFRNLVTSRINIINNRILEYSNEKLDGQSCGTTLSVGVVFKEHLHIVHIGDCRVYRINNNSIEKLTQDHSYVAELVKGGLISKEEAHNHPDRNRITRALGFKDHFSPDFYSIPITAGDVFVFCTDGLYEDINDDEIFNIVINEPRESLAFVLVEKAKARGGNDNITVIVAWM